MVKLTRAIWILGVIFLAALLLPAPWLASLLPVQSPEPFDSWTALILFVRSSLALVIAAVLLYLGVALYKTWQDNKAVRGRKSPRRRPHTAAGVVVAVALSVLVLASGLYNLRWLLIWDSTTDPLGAFWLPIPIFGAFFAGMYLLAALPGKLKVVGVLYTFVVAGLLLTVSTSAMRVDFRQLTVERAEQTTRALETYHARHGRYPRDLGQLTPWTTVTLPGPVIIFGQHWCYDGGADYYRLGYVYREHWSDPRLIGRIHKTVGEVPEQPPLCTEEITSLQQRYPSYPYSHWIGDES